MTTKIRKEQIEEIIQPQATADWTKDDITASAKAIHALISAFSCPKLLTSGFKIANLNEGLYMMKQLVLADWGRGSISLSDDALLVVMNYGSYTDRRKWVIIETNGDVWFGESWPNYGEFTKKSLSSLKNMVGASSSAAGSAGFAPTPAAGDNLKFLRGDATWQNIPNMVGATSAAAGSAGLVPTPAAGDEMKVLRGDGTWANITMILEPVAIGYLPGGLYRYALEYNGQPISYNEIDSAKNKGLPIILNHYSGQIKGYWPLDLVYNSTLQNWVLSFKQVAVYQNQLQCRRLIYTVENDTEFWDEIIEYTTT